MIEHSQTVLSHTCETMPFIEWNDVLSVNNPLIDADHKRLFDLINTLHEAMVDNRGSTIVGPVLGELIDYAKTHFHREEELMLNSSYPHLAEHKAEHDVLRKETDRLQGQFSDGAAGVTLETMDFLRNWLFHHIMKSDYQLSQWIAKT